MTAPVFVDTNVFVYALDASEPEKQRQAAAWLDELWARRAGRTSFQVLQELYVNLTRKLSRPLAEADARTVTRALLTWNPSPPDAACLNRAWELQDRYGLSWWDSLIVASAGLQGCRYLLTEDLQPGQDLAGVVVVDPFAASPAELLGDRLEP